MAILGVDMKQLTDEQKAKLGQQWAEILMLKRSKEHKDRYLTTELRFATPKGERTVSLLRDLSNNIYEMVMS